MKTGYISVEKLMKLYLSSDFTGVLFLKEQLTERFLKGLFCALIPVNINTKTAVHISEKI